MADMDEITAGPLRGLHRRAQSDRRLTAAKRATFLEGLAGSFGRMYHDHRGKAEGKKVGRAVIAVLAEAGPPALPTPEPPHAALAPRPGVEVRVDMTCDCGHMASLAEDELAEANDCPACGRTNTHTPEEIARVKVELVRLREETQARLDAGIPVERIVADHRKRDG